MLLEDRSVNPDSLNRHKQIGAEKNMFAYDSVSLTIMPISAEPSVTRDDMVNLMDCRCG
ncbi:hypothetical protein Hdeb2414_s0002g00043841 [Helianthus debilis subsp. tardiflorus]